MSKETEPLIINTPEDGFLRIGNTTEDRKLRPDQVQLGAGCGSSLRIFEDGGWELRSQPNKKGCNLIAKGDGGLHIYSEGDVNIDARGDFNVSAKNITMETTAEDGDFTVFCKRDIMLDADNNFTSSEIPSLFKFLVFALNTSRVVPKTLNPKLSKNLER